MTSARSPEYWVVRVLLHHGRPVQLSHELMSPGVYKATYAKVDAGDYVLLPDFTIAEPVMNWREEHDAHAHREQLVKDHPGVDFRVLLTVDVAV